jgi:putative oxidoreductase
MKIVVTGVRIILGLVFFVFGLNIFFQFIKTPSPDGDATELMHLMFKYGWFNVIGTLEVLGGVLLLSGRFVPLGLTILGPILLVIVLFHSTLAPAGLALALFWTVMELYLIYAYRSSFEPVLNPNAKPVFKTKAIPE